MRIRTFKTKKSQQYFFNFLTNDGDVILRSEGYTTKEACNNGKDSVLKNANTEARYERLTSADGRQYFNLKAANGQVIGTSVMFDTAEEREKAISLLKGLGQRTAVKATTKETDQEAPKSALERETKSKKDNTEKKPDDYRDYLFYNMQKSGAESGFDSFQGSDDQEFYFTFNRTDGTTLLVSQGYTSASGRDNGIQSVRNNASVSERYSRHETSEGLFFFTLKAANNQEIARSVYFVSEGEMEDGIRFLMASGGSTVATKEAGAVLSREIPTAKAISGGIYKDYKPLSFYEEKIEGVDFGYDSFSHENKHFFTLNFEGKPLLLSEDYTTSAARNKGIASIKKNVKNDKRYARKIHPNGKHYFNLVAANKEEIATSIWFDEDKDMEKAIRWLQSTGGTRRRKKQVREKKPAAERRIIQTGLSYPCSDINYETFQSGGNGRFYFKFITKDEKAILINGDVRGHKTEEDMQKAITEILKFGPDEKKYVKKETRNGKFYFYIQNEKGRNIARSSLFYDSEAEMNESIRLLACGTAVAVPGIAVSTADEYLPCEAYKGGAGFFKFRNEDNGEYYFSFNDEQGKTFLRSEGYTSESGRDNGISSVQKNAQIEERWKTMEENARWFYVLRAGNNQEIARSCPYDSEGAMLAAFSWIRGEHSTIGAGAKFVGNAWMSAFAIRKMDEENAARREAEAAARREAELEAAREAAAAEEAEKAKSSKISDDYLLCEDYVGEDGFHKFYREDRGEHYFSYNKDGRVMLRSEGYTTQQARNNGIDSVIRNAPDESRWKKETAMNGRYHYYVLRAGNNQEIARSCYYDTEEAMLLAFASITGEDSEIGFGSSMVGGVLMSALMLGKKKEEEAAAKALEEARLAEAAAKKAEAEKAEAARLAAMEAEAAKKKAEAEKEEAARLAVMEAEAAKKKAEAEEAARLAAIAAAKKEKEAAAASAGGAGASPTQFVEEAGSSGGWGFLRWLIPLVLLLLFLLLMMRYCGSCGNGDQNGSTSIIPPVEQSTASSTAIDTLGKEATTDAASTSASSEAEVVPEPFGLSGEEMGFGGMAVGKIADHLRGPQTAFPATFALDEVMFGTNSAVMNRAGRREMDRLAEVLKAYPNATIEILGNIDASESEEYKREPSITLSGIRARCVYKKLAERGIATGRMTYRGMGGTNPIAPNDTQPNRRKNRRIEIVLKSR